MRNMVGQLYANPKGFSDLLNHLTTLVDQYEQYKDMDVVQVAVLDTNNIGIVVEVIAEGTKKHSTSQYTIRWEDIV